MEDEIDISLGRPPSDSYPYRSLKLYSRTKAQLTSFLSHLREIYRRQNSYHNFRHALDVLQAIHVFLYSAGVVPPVSILMLRGDAKTWRPDKAVQSNPYLSCLGNQELFALYIAAIGHDVGHPGFTNNFMVTRRMFYVSTILIPNAEKRANTTLCRL